MKAFMTSAAIGSIRSFFYGTVVLVVAVVVVVKSTATATTSNTAASAFTAVVLLDLIFNLICSLTKTESDELTGIFWQ